MSRRRLTTQDHVNTALQGLAFLDELGGPVSELQYLHVLAAVQEEIAQRMDRVRASVEGPVPEGIADAAVESTGLSTDDVEVTGTPTRAGDNGWWVPCRIWVPVDSDV